MNQLAVASPLFRGGYVSDKVRGLERAGQRLAVAQERIEPGELVSVFSGAVITAREVAELGALAGRTCLQIDESLFLVSNSEDPSDWINHSCDPNLGLRGQIVLVALRPIEIDEELCFDYAMSDGSAYDEFDCGCGTPRCRGRVSGDDWRRPELQERYRGYFSPYLALRIARLGGR